MRFGIFFKQKSQKKKKIKKKKIGRTHPYNQNPTTYKLENNCKPTLTDKEDITTTRS
jgi:hypothetical protein